MPYQQYISARVNLGLFNKSFDELRIHGIPSAVVRGFSKTAHRGQRAARVETERAFDLHSDYILRGIKYIPEEKAVASKKNWKASYKTFRAAIFVRSSNTPNKSLDFLVLHETSGAKAPHGKNRRLALPRKDIYQFKYKTRRGRTAKRWKPDTLLDYYNKHPKRGPGRRHPRSKPPAFLIKKKGKPLRIARRKDKRNYPIFILYEFFPKARIKRSYKFVDRVTKCVIKNVVRDTQNEIAKIDVLQGTGPSRGFGSIL